MSPKTFRLLGYGAWTAGLAALVVLVALQGFGDVLAATAAAEWGLLWVSLVQLGPMLADSVAWQRLLGSPAVRAPLRLLLWARWIAEAANNLLPVASVGGELLRAWLVNRAGRIPGAVAGASVVVDLTLGVLTQLVFTSMGVGVLLVHDDSGALVEAALAGGGVLCVCLLLFFLAQRAGLFGFSGRLVQAVAGRAGWTSVVDDAQTLDRAIRSLYARRRVVAASASWRLLGWLAGVLEVWAALWFLGHPVSFAEALMLESLVQALRSAAFMVPGALGVQEGGLIALGAVVGLGPEVSLALSLVKRVRELLWGLPALAFWQASELHRLWRAGSRRRSPPGRVLAQPNVER